MRRRTAIRRRITIATAASLAIVLAASGCSRSSSDAAQNKAPTTSNALELTPALLAAADKEGAVNLQYTIPVATMQKLVKEFTAVYPKIKVTLTRKSGAPGGAAIMQDYQSGVKYTDVAGISDITTGKQVIGVGAIAPLSPPDAALFPKQYILGPGLYSPVTETTVVGFNKNLVTPQEALQLRDWNALLDPKWKGKISVVTPSTSSGGIPMLYATETYGEDWLTKLKAQKPVFFDGTAPSRDALVAGQQAIAVGQFDGAMLDLVKSGAPVGYEYPNPTPIWGAHAWGVLSNAPHPNAARVLWAWLLSKQMAEGPTYQNEVGTSTLTGVKDARVGVPTDQPWYHAAGPDFWTPTPEDWETKLPANQKLFAKVMGTH